MQGVTVYSAATTGDGLTLRVIDYRRAALTSSPAAADGALTCQFDGPEAGRMWLVQRVTVSATSSAATTCSVYAGQPAPANLIDRTYLGNDDVADEAAPALVPSSVPLVVTWSGASAGSSGTATIQYQLVELA